MRETALETQVFYVFSLSFFFAFGYSRRERMPKLYMVRLLILHLRELPAL